MKGNYLKLIITFVVCVFSAVSCTNDFEEINTNPNQPEDLSTPGLLLPAIIRESLNDSYNGSWNRGNIVADYLADQFVSAFDWSPADAEGYFLWTYYDRLRNVMTMHDLALESDLKNYQGIALVWKSFLFHSMTDIYGDIPYSEAVKAKTDNVNFPRYDRQEDIYNGILADLKEANSLLSTSNEAVSGDILYNGDILKWKKFANSLRLRCLLRISGRKDPSAEMHEIVSNPGAYPIFTGNQDQAALQYLDQLGNEFPRYRAFGFGASAAENLVNVLKGLNDPRLYVFAQATPSTAESANPEYVGVPNGIANESTFNGGPANQSLPGLLWAPISANPDLASKTAVQTLIMTYAELQLILAEAAENGYITGNASDYYQAGIHAACDYYASRIPDNYTFPKPTDVIPGDSYFAQDAVAYSGTHDEKLKKIWTQKWISLYNVGFEGWSEWRRTGVPEIKPGPNSLGFVPVRFLYPLSEQNANQANYAAAVAVQGPDNTQTRVWWDID
ncbi:MAG TPA: SusD/RagB family nutrient-binding outer membrane lipoprotein [Chryseolinea sp.]|nr:SusD/RagB family nutrient-binding outer membrane lipoprotein [Chryseolinea sp.]